MSYEYKEIIKSRVYEPNALPLYWEAQTRGVGAHIVIRDALKELDHVYAQADKADEYEAKAKAFDDIREARKEVLTDVRARGLKLPADLDKFSLMTERIINEYERGESE